MNGFINSLIEYCNEAKFDSMSFWAIPICTILFIWLITVIGLKIFSKRKNLKTVFIINRAWIVSSLIAACILIGLICYGWISNFFAQHPYQLVLLITLSISMLISLLALINLRSYYTSDKIKDIAEQPKTAHQLDFIIVLTKRAFTANKVFFIIPLLGFILLLLNFYKGTNLITLVFDNSGSMVQTTAIDALTETFDNLDENNEIILTTLNGSNYKRGDLPGGNAKTSITELMQVNKSGNLFGGNVTSFQNPREARGVIAQITGFECCSPICESIWKSYLYIKESKSNETYNNKLLIVVTDGVDNYINESLVSGKFFFDDDGFNEFFPSENVFIIDYSQGGANAFIQKCASSGCDIYPAENNKQAYIDALDNALQSFKNNWFLVYWTVIIFSLFTIVALLIQPKKIV